MNVQARILITLINLLKLQEAEFLRSYDAESRMTNG